MKKTKSKAPAMPREGMLGRYLQEEVKKPRNRSYFTTLSPNTKLVLRLIYEDLKGHKFFEALRELGLDDNFYQPELSTLVLDFIGATHQIKDSLTFYYLVMCKHSKRMKADRRAIARETIAVYRTLMAAKMKKTKKQQKGAKEDLQTMLRGRHPSPTTAL